MIQSPVLVGRDSFLALVERRLADAAAGEGGLLFVAGEAGIGKTRLAMQVAAELVDTFADGVWFVRLARLVDPGLVVPTIAQTLGLREAGSVPITALLRE